MKNSSYKLILVILLVLISIIGDSILKFTVENTTRKQIRYNLENIENCINKSFYNGVNFNDAEMLCTEKSKISKTSSTYILDLGTLEFIEDESNNISKDKLYFTKDSFGKNFHNWDSGLKALSYLTSGFSSKNYLNISYNHDGFPEWLEWILIDTTKLKLDPQLEEYKIIDEDITHTKILHVIVQSAKKDEILSNYNFLRIFYFVSISIVILILLYRHISVYGPMFPKSHKSQKKE